MISQTIATSRLNTAVRRGEVTPLDECQLCDKPGYTVAHHWRGYDYPTDVWWVCNPCNTLLSGKHDGSLTLAEAREYVGSGSSERETYQFTARLRPDQDQKLHDIAAARRWPMRKLIETYIEAGLVADEQLAIANQGASDTTWYYVIYTSRTPGSKPSLSSKHRKFAAAQRFMERQLADPYWRVYDWAVTTEKPADIICLSR